jgi:hypothetical protein
MGKMMPETCWAVFERQEINLRDWSIWLVDLFEYLGIFVQDIWNSLLCSYSVTQLQAPLHISVQTVQIAVAVEPHFIIQRLSVSNQRFLRLSSWFIHWRWYSVISLSLPIVLFVMILPFPYHYRSSFLWWSYHFLITTDRPFCDDLTISLHAI